MDPRSKIRRFEFLLITTSTALIVTSGLIRDARNFDKTIEKLLSHGEPSLQVLGNLRPYNHTLHHNLPVIVGAILTLTAWYLVHFHLVPKKRKNKLNLSAVGISLASLALVAWGQLAFLSTVCINATRTFGLGSPLEMIYAYRYRMNLYGYTAFPDILVGTKLNSQDEIVLNNFGDTSYIILAIHTLLVAGLFFAYELAMQQYYKLYERLVTPNSRKVISVLSITLFFIFVCIVLFKQTEIARLMILAPFYLFLTFVMYSLVVYVAQEFIYRASPTSASHKLKAFLLNGSLYLIIIVSGALFMKVINYGFTYEDVEDSSDFFEYFWIPCLSLIFFSLPIGYARRSMRKKRLLREVELLLKKAELAHLRTQINPHFLFNTLNALYVLAKVDKSTKVADGIQKLGGLMHFVLHDKNNEQIRLEDEIAYLKNYVDLQVLRLDTSDCDVIVNISDVTTDFTIAPMLLNTFVENSFKHGISFQAPSWISITLNMDQDRLFFEVGNSVHTHKPADGKKGGIGLENVKKRLEMIYPNRHTLIVDKNELEYVVTLSIDFTTNQDKPPR